MDPRDDLVHWLRSAVPPSGVVEATYSAVAGAAELRVGFDTQSHSWYFLDQTHYVLHQTGQDTVTWFRQSGKSQSTKPYDGDDCGVADLIPVLGILDVASRQEVIKKLESDAGGAIIVSAEFPRGGRCADPQFESRSPEVWTYHLSGSGSVTALSITGGSNDENVVYSYSAISPPEFALPATAFRGTFRLTEARFTAATPADFFAVGKLQSKVSEVKDRSAVALAEMTKAKVAAITNGTPVPSSDPYNPLSNYGFPAVLAGVVILGIVAFAWWRRGR